MKKYFLATFFLIAFTFMLEPTRSLMSKFLLVEQPQYHQIQEGEWLSKIAIKYYGDASYWRELELINRAPNGDKIYPGENIIIPSYEAMREIRTTQRLSSVNDLIQTQERLIASGYRQERAPVSEAVEESEPTVSTVPVVQNGVEDDKKIAIAIQFEEAEMIEQKAQEDAPLVVYEETPESDYFVEDTDFGQQASKSNMFLFGMGAIVVLALGIFFYIRKKKSEDVEYYGDVQQLDEVKEDEKEEEVEAEKESEPVRLHQNFYMTEKDETESRESRKEEKINEKEFVS